MVMKDKLEKTHHKGSYYLAKKISIALLAIMSGAFIIAIPTYITQVSMKKQTAGNAQEIKNETSSENEDSSEYESFSI